MVRWYGGKKMEESSSKPRKVHYRAHRHMPDYYFIRPNGPLWSWSYGSLMNNHLYYQCLSLLKLWVRTLFMARCTRYNNQGVKWSYIPRFSRFCYISYICLIFLYFIPKSYIFPKLWEQKLNLLFWVEISYKHDK